MNKIIIIGNLTKDPQLSVTPQGISVCQFTIAVNERKNSQNETQYFRVSAWRQLGENCQRYLVKGRKAFVSGPLTVRQYTANDGSTRFSLEVTANDVEFLSSRQDDAYTEAPAAHATPTGGFIPVETDELPFDTDLPW